MSAAKRMIVISVVGWVLAMVVLLVTLWPIMFPKGQHVGKFNLRDGSAFVTVQAQAGDLLITRTSFEANVDGDFLESVLLERPLHVIVRGPENLDARCDLYTGKAYSSDTSETHGKVTGIPNDCEIRIRRAGTYRVSADNPFDNHLIEDEQGRRPMPLRMADMEVRIERAAKK